MTLAPESSEFPSLQFAARPASPDTDLHDPAKIDRLVDTPEYWEDLEHLFNRELTDEAIAVRADDPDAFAELSQERKNRLEVILENPAVAIRAYMERVSTSRYKGRIVPPDPAKIDVFAIGEDQPVVKFGTRSRRVPSRLDDIFEIRRYDHGGSEYLYSGLQARMHSPVYTVRVTKNGECEVFTESYEQTKDGIKHRVIPAEGSEKDRLLRKMFADCFEASAVVEARSEAESKVADADALRRHEALVRSRDPYLYHLTDIVEG